MEFDQARAIFDELISDTENSFFWREAARNGPLAGRLNRNIAILESHLSRVKDSESDALLDQIRAFKTSAQP